MEFLNIKSGKIFPQWDPSEIIDQTLLDQAQAKLKLLLELVNSWDLNYTKDHPLLAVYQELLSEQELR